MKTRSASGVVRSLCALAAIAAVPGSQGLAEGPKPVPTTVAAKSADAALDPAAAQRRAQPIATFQGGQVTLGELEDTLAQQTPFMRNRYRDPKALQELVDRMVRFELLANEATRQQWDQRKPVQEAVAQNAVQAMMRVEFDEKLSASSVPKQDIDAYYKTHIDEYVQPAMQRASHVLVATEAEAKDLLAQAQSMDVRAFRQLARDKSIDEATKMQGGDLHYFDLQGNVRGENAGPVPPQIVKAAFTLKTVGDTLAKPVKIDRGYSILKLTGTRPALSRKLDEVADTIRAKLWRERREQAVEAFVSKLREQNPPQLHAELIDLIKLEQPEEKPGTPPAVHNAPPAGPVDIDESPSAQHPIQKPGH